MAVKIEDEFGVPLGLRFWFEFDRVVHFESRVKLMELYPVFPGVLLGVLWFKLWRCLFWWRWFRLCWITTVADTPGHAWGCRFYMLLRESGMQCWPLFFFGYFCYLCGRKVW